MPLKTELNINLYTSGGFSDGHYLYFFTNVRISSIKNVSGQASES